MSFSPGTLTCLKFLQSTLMTASDGRTDPADTEDRMAATVATPKVSLWMQTNTIPSSKRDGQNLDSVCPASAQIIMWRCTLTRRWPGPGWLTSPSGCQSFPGTTETVTAWGAETGGDAWQSRSTTSERERSHLGRIHGSDEVLVNWWSVFSHHGLVSIGVSGLMKPLSHIHLLLMNFDLDANKHTEKSLIQRFIFYISLSQLLYSSGQAIYGSRVATELRYTQVKPTKSKFLPLHQIFSLILKE